MNKTVGVKKWWQTGFFGMHYDLHANKNDTELGAGLTHKNLKEQLEKIRPDYVQCDCKGHPGYTSYPTRIGSPSPGIVKDALRIHREVTREMNIPLSVHYSGVWDTRAVELHPDWSALDSEGKFVIPRPGRPPGIICLLSPYLEELMIPQLLEIIDLYDVDGFWIDGDNWAVRDCYCDRCRKEFYKRTGIKTPPVDKKHPDWPVWRAFQRSLFTEYVDKYTRAVHERKPDCAVCSNWMYSMRQPGPVTVPVDYLSGDFSSSFGAERAEMEGRYIDGHRMPWNLMAWTFCSPSPDVPYQTKTVTHLCQESAEVMSCGGGVFLYGKPRRKGWLTDWEHDIFAKTASFCRQRQMFVQNTSSVPETAVLLSDAHIWNHNTEPFCMGEGFFSMEGALHALIENQYHVDVLDETRLKEGIGGYSLVVVGEQNPVSAGVEDFLESYVQNGGIVLITGSHLAEKHPALTGVAKAGEIRQENWCMASRGEAFVLHGPWCPVKPEGSEVYTRVMSNQQIDKDETEYPGVTIRRAGKGFVAAVHGDFMHSYYLSHNPRMRLFIKDLLETIGVKRKVVVSGPPSLEVTLRSRGNLFFVNLVNRAVSPTLTPRLHMVEEVTPAYGVQVRLCMDKKPVASTLEPGGRALEWSYENGWFTTSVPRVDIHDIVVVEKEGRGTGKCRKKERT